MSATIKTSQITLLYGDASYPQPLDDIVESGTLIDPETGEDMDITGIEITEGADVSVLAAPHLDGILIVWKRDNGEIAYQNLVDIVNDGCAIDEETGDDLELSHVEVPVEGN